MPPPASVRSWRRYPGGSTRSCTSAARSAGDWEVAHKRQLIFAEHHESHAASAFFPSPFHQAAILTLDGVGEWATASYGCGRGNRIAIGHELRFPHSLGLLYSAFTYFCGFRVNSGEYKLMGLAPYGEPKYAELILEKLVDLKPDGSLRMDLSYFNFCQGRTMTLRKFSRLFGGPPRKAEGPLGQREMDLAASVQKVTEEIVLRAARHVHRETGMKDLCLAGGVALNCVANGRILREGPFERLWIQPAAGDAGGAWGWPCSSGTSFWETCVDLASRTPSRGPCWVRDSPRRKCGPFWNKRERATISTRTKTHCAAERPTCSRREM